MSFFIGLTAGVFGGLVGLGGGVVMIPMMVGLLKVSRHKANGTSLIALVFTGVTGTAVYGMNQNVNLAASILLAIPAMFTARLGARCCNSLPEWKLRRAFGIFLIAVSVLMAAKSYLPHPASPLTEWIKAVVLITTGLMTGFLAGLMGVGGGVLMIASMVLIAGYDQQMAQGSTLLAIIPGSMAGAYAHWRLGNTEGHLLKGLIPGILLGTWLGGSLANVLSDVNLRIVFAAVLIWVGFQHLKMPPPVDSCMEQSGHA